MPQGYATAPPKTLAELIETARRGSPPPKGPAIQPEMSWLARVAQQVEKWMPNDPVGILTAPMGGGPKAKPKGSTLADLVEDYRGQHSSPGPEAAPLHDLTGGGTVYPDDVYSRNQAQYYGDRSGHDAATFRLVNYMKGKPDAPVTIFRAVPKDAPDVINPGDWVTINRGYALSHGEGPLSGDYKVISKQVKASEIFTNGDSIHEWGYHPAPVVKK